VNEAKDLKASIRVFDLNSKLLFLKEVTFSVNSNKSEKVLSLDPITQAVFLDIRISDKSGNQLAQNFYWLSEKQDVFAWDKTTWAYTPQKDFADHTGLNHIPDSQIKASYKTVELNNQIELTTTIANNSDKIAFFLNLVLLDGKGSQVFPLFWDDNYISLLPGEKRNLKCSVPKNSLKGAKPELIISGWNVASQKILLK
jgi:exo-1,4-beta-D-glucosaminidase